MLQCDANGMETVKIPTFLDREKLKEFYQIIKPIQIVTDILQADSLTSNICLLSLLNAGANIKKVDCRFYGSFQMRLLEELKKRFDNSVMKAPVYILASVLDPRQHLTLFKSSKEKRLAMSLKVPSKEQAIQVLKDAFADFSDGSRTPVTLTAASVPKSAGIYSLIDEISEELRADKQDEIESYINLDCENIDAISFWRANKQKFPTLYNIAMSVLACPASSGSVERLFSVAGALRRHRRNRLHISTVEKLLLYRENI